MKITKRMMEKACFAAHEFLDDRFPMAALPGGVQTFADAGDSLARHGKHEQGCEDLARAVLTAALTRTNAKRK